MCYVSVMRVVVFDVWFMHWFRISEDLRGSHWVFYGMVAGWHGFPRNLTLSLGRSDGGGILAISLVSVEGR